VPPVSGFAAGGDLDPGQARRIGRQLDPHQHLLYPATRKVRQSPGRPGASESFPLRCGMVDDPWPAGRTGVAGNGAASRYWKGATS
jgi:hypothetical protein